jgi:hypothetical protein
VRSTGGQPEHKDDNLTATCEAVTSAFSSVFVFSLRAAFDCVFNLKTLKVHDMFRSLRPSSGVKLWIEEVAVLAFLWFISHICLTNMGNEP